ncbi:transcriptional regulator, TrmB [Chthoniobacter flavus Ellin428]|uniref:Transcriptional regulator, TrmB n=1 Tax=Chthoniobacter flavus Ellin428 TaxID=497964 RepID=B4CZJ9_9BACT|nr:metalloregulator ArsR/SmtB family transcription factor [Chthoniobacter flavus]EDY20163.1 transcriptional regulator, TrmB [Chthoniobacter flavus Ellin428]TCO94061.1 ArsR family transcriptional regulator [Chthoniobacter flavus]
MVSIVKSLRLLADETRLRLLLLLRKEELSVVEIQEVLGMGQSRISSHLAQLRQAGLVRDRRAGKNIYYALVDSGAHAELHSIIEAAARELPEAARDQVALKVALKKRDDKAREYFNQLAGKFGRAYCPGRTWDGVAHMLFTLVPSMVIADLGAGEGTLSQLLAKRAKKVIAVDNSEKMVEFGSGLAKKHGFKNLEYRLGEMEEPPIPANSVDLALLSQALHHAPNPQRAITAAHHILKKGGRIAVLDLLAHQFEEARELYADRWLGFSEADLQQFLEEAGFHEIEVQIVSREAQPPHFQTVLATGVK